MIMKNALLVPGVFFLTLLSAVTIFAFFGGLTLYYELAVPASEFSGFLWLCIAKKACSTFPVAIMAAIISVYAFLMRHHAKPGVVISLFCVCLIFTVTVIIPACYAFIPSIEAALKVVSIQPAADKALTAFINKPVFLAVLEQASDAIFKDLYAAYVLSFTGYLIFVCTLFFCISSFWTLCTATQWNMVNFLLLCLFTGIFLFLYPYMQRDEFQFALSNLHLDSKNSMFGIPLTLCSIALIFHFVGGLKILLHISKNKKGRAA